MKRKGTKKGDLVITVFNREEVFVTFSIEQKTRAVDLLEEQKIPYRVIVHNRNKDGMGSRNRTGTFGQDMSMMYEYHIYIHRDDGESARGILMTTQAASAHTYSLL